MERWEKGREKKIQVRRTWTDPVLDCVLKPKNVRKPERVVGWLPIDSNFLPHDSHSAPYLTVNPFLPLFLLYSFYIFIFHIFPPNTVPSSSLSHTHTTRTVPFNCPQSSLRPHRRFCHLPPQNWLVHPSLPVSYPDYPQQVPFVRTTRQFPGITFPHAPTITSPLPHTCHRPLRYASTHEVNLKRP